jgi:predicted DNA-binding protein (MmcQ/YjbR family)
MDIDALRRHCLSFPHSTENVQWGSDLCFKVDGKLFLVTGLEPGVVQLSFKCAPEAFAELCERPGVRPAPYLARAHWIALEKFNTLPDRELRELIADSYRLVWERLPKRRQQQLQEKAGAPASKARAVKSATKPKVVRAKKRAKASRS